MERNVTSASRAWRGRTLWVWGLALALLAGGCRSDPAGGTPSITFSTIPAGIEGGPQALTTIAGRVRGARPGQRLVLFAKSGIWWVQPESAHPFTSIQRDTTWTSQTHYGFEYAALLVDAGYTPPSTVDVLPSPGGGVVAVATTKGGDSPVARKTLQFSGYEWEVRQSVSERGGTINPHDPANAWTDDQGFLHLRIAPHDGGWTSAEVTLTRSLGYGTYLFVVRDTGHLEPAAVFSMFTWDPTGTDPNHRELDIEMTRWGDPVSKNAQFVVQPYYVPANVARFAAPSGPLTHSFHWEPGRVLFRTVRGALDGAAGTPVAEQLFTSGVPTPGGEAVRMSTYVFVHTQHPLQNGAEVVVEKFVYLP